jgi:CII-binding regulator of phage lambda lysogenization HflD
VVPDWVGRTPHLPGIALESEPLFLVERGVALLAALVVGITLVARTFKRQLPKGLSTIAGSLMYAETVEAAARSSDTAAADLVERLDEQDRQLTHLNATVNGLVDSLAEIRTVVLSDLPPTPPET